MHRLRRGRRVLVWSSPEEDFKVLCQSSSDADEADHYDEGATGYQGCVRVAQHPAPQNPTAVVISPENKSTHAGMTMENEDSCDKHAEMKIFHDTYVWHGK